MCKRVKLKKNMEKTASTKNPQKNETKLCRKKSHHRTVSIDCFDFDASQLMNGMGSSFV